MVGAEMPMTSDQVIWSEQNRLHVAYRNCTNVTASGATFDVLVTLDLSTATVGADAPNGAVRVGQTILLSDRATGLVTQKMLVQAVTSSSGTLNDVLDCTIYETDTIDPALAGANLSSCFVYGSEYGKGSTGMDATIQPQFTQYSNSPIILKDNFEINGSDTARS